MKYDTIVSITGYVTVTLSLDALDYTMYVIG